MGGLPEIEARTRRQTVALGAILATVSSGAASEDVRRKDVSSFAVSRTLKVGSLGLLIKGSGRER